MLIRKKEKEVTEWIKNGKKALTKEKSHFFEKLPKKLLKSVILSWGNRGKEQRS